MTLVAHREIHLGGTLQQRQGLSDLRGDHVALGSPRKAAYPDFALDYCIQYKITRVNQYLIVFSKN